MTPDALIDACAAAGNDAIRQYAHALGAVPHQKPWPELSEREWATLRTRTRDALLRAPVAVVVAEDILFVSVVRAMAAALGMPGKPTAACEPETEPRCYCGGKGRGHNGFHFEGAPGCLRGDFPVRAHAADSEYERGRRDAIRDVIATIRKSESTRGGKR